MYSCGNTPTTNSTTTTTEQEKPTPLTEIKIAQLPINITSQEGARDWMAKNYWNLFPASDTAYIESEELKNAFAMWTMLLLETPLEVATVAINHNLTKMAAAEPLMHDEFIRLGEGFLGDPNSEMRNDNLFIALLDYIIASPAVDSLNKIRPQALRSMTLKNRVGDTANNFTWRNATDTKGSLHAIKTPLTLLFFYTPGCESCKELIAAISNNPLIKEMVANKKIQLLAIYTELDTTEWEEYQTNIGKEWINGMTDNKFDTDEPFAIRSTPSIYLLDNNKKVLVRDAASLVELSNHIK